MDGSLSPESIARGQLHKIRHTLFAILEAAWSRQNGRYQKMIEPKKEENEKSLPMQGDSRGKLNKHLAIWAIERKYPRLGRHVHLDGGQSPPAA